MTPPLTHTVVTTVVRKWMLVDTTPPLRVTAYVRTYMCRGLRVATETYSDGVIMHEVKVWGIECKSDGTADMRKTKAWHYASMLDIESLYALFGLDADGNSEER